MKRSNLILESLANLDRPAVKQLFANAAHSGIFVPEQEPTDNILFIFPDGNMLAYNELNGTMHQEIYDVLTDDKRLTGKDIHHPALDPILAEYYNLVVVIPGDELGVIVVPTGVEPTSEQNVMIDELESKFGYELATIEEIFYA
jgi:hypothetical protein